ncbi:MAG: hypothetical protein ACR2LI_01400 [Propionibacteriaceae bacterium]
MSTPRLLRLLTASLVALCVLTGLLGLVGFLSYSQSLGRAQHNAEQLVRVQQIQADLLRADAQATNAFLVGGLEPAESRARYDAAMAETTRLVAAAAEAQPADADALASLNDAVLRYASTVEQARANNRQGFPVGSQYLRNASAQLRAEALPICTALVTANTVRTDQETGAGGGAGAIGFVVAGIVTLAALVAAMIIVARRFRRTLNLGLVAAGVCVLVGLIIGIGVLAQVGGAVAGVREGPGRGVSAAAAVRIAANDAKANESLTLIARGSGGAFETAWQGLAGTVQAGFGDLATVNATQTEDLRTRWKRYTSTHEAIRQLDDGGQWNLAVARATGAGRDSSNVVFGTFDDGVAELLATSAAETTQDLGAPRTGLTVAAVLSILLGLGAAFAARAGIATRLKEYQ